jgi:uncharacterized membrane protein
MPAGGHDDAEAGAHHHHPARRRGYGRPVMALALAGHLEYDRILFFTDAVFAIAITLLIVELPGPIVELATSQHHAALDSGTLLHESIAGIIGFWISFAVIGLFWIGHHSLFRYITAFDRALMLLNLLFVGVIAFLPYPTAVLSITSNSQRAAVVFYAICAGAAGLLETLAWVYARRAHLVGEISPQASRLLLARVGRVPAVFAVSIPIALLGSARAATYSWIAIVVLGIAINHRYGHHDSPAPDRAETPAEG